MCDTKNRAADPTDSVTFTLAETDEQIRQIARLAEEIWNQHFVPIIGQAQVDYMVEKFQSYPALCEQIREEGYEYYQIRVDDVLVGYTGVHPEPDTKRLFLSKLYVHQDFRGSHIATRALQFLIQLCKDRGLTEIYLTCNKHNTNTLQIYEHLGFTYTRNLVTDIGGGFVMDDYEMTYKI